MDKIIGMGNALVDALVHIESDSVLDAMNLPKGSMQLIDERRFDEVSRKNSGTESFACRRRFGFKRYACARQPWSYSGIHR